MQKTKPAFGGGINPKWNVFLPSFKRQTENVVEVEIWDYNKIANDFLGKGSFNIKNALIEESKTFDVNIANEIEDE